MLEVKSIRFEGPESNLELCWHIWLENSRFGVNIEHSHVLTVESLSLLVNPEDVQFSLKFVGDFDFLLSTQSEHITKSKFQ